MHKRSMNIVTASWQVCETRRNRVDKVDFPTFGLCPGVSLVYHPKKTHGWNLNFNPFEKRNQTIFNNIIVGFQPFIFGGVIFIYKLTRLRFPQDRTFESTSSLNFLWDLTLMLDFTTRMLDFKQHTSETCPVLMVDFLFSHQFQIVHLKDQEGWVPNKNTLQGINISPL